MNVKEFAERLNGREYRSEITHDETLEAESLGFLVVYGRSDDLVELDGAVCDELASHDDDFEFVVSSNGVLPNWEEFIDDDPAEAEVEKYFADKAQASVKIVAKWGGDGGPVWFMDVAETDRDRVDFAEFTVNEDGEPHCRGIVVDLGSLRESPLTPPHEVEPLTESVINNWRHWAKRKDGGEGDYGPGRMRAIDSIFDAAIVGMGLVKSSRSEYAKTTAKQLRELADSLDREAAE